VDLKRVMVLRTASNYTMPPPGKTTVWSTTAPYPEEGRPALEAAYRVGNKVAQHIIKGWATYRDQLPSDK
jgi:purine nucleoside permease